MTKPVFDKMAENYIKLVNVPNVTRIVQQLDLTANRFAKVFIKKHFTECYSSCIVPELDVDKDVDNIDIQLKMSILKLLHAQWIIDIYNYLTSFERREITSNGLKVAFIK